MRGIPAGRLAGAVLALLIAAATGADAGEGAASETAGESGSSMPAKAKASHSQALLASRLERMAAQAASDDAVRAERDTRLIGPLAIEGCSLEYRMPHDPALVARIDLKQFTQRAPPVGVTDREGRAVRLVLRSEAQAEHSKTVEQFRAAYRKAKSRHRSGGAEDPGAVAWSDVTRAALSGKIGRHLKSNHLREERDGTVMRIWPVHASFVLVSEAQQPEFESLLQEYGEMSCSLDSVSSANGASVSLDALPAVEKRIEKAPGTAPRLLRREPHRSPDSAANGESRSFDESLGVEKPGEKRPGTAMKQKGIDIGRDREMVISPPDRNGEALLEYR